MSTAAYAPTPNEVLASLGYTTRPGTFAGRKQILCDGEVLQEGTANQNWIWLRDTGRLALTIEGRACLADAAALTPFALDQNDPKFRRMRCDCCDRPVAFRVGTFAYYVCESHKDSADDELRRLYEKKHGVTVTEGGRP